MDESDGGGLRSLEEQWKKLRLSEEERVVVDVGEEVEGEVWEQGERSLVGKICLERLISKEVLSSTMNRIWRISKPAEFREVSENKFVITFHTVADKLRVMDGRPWLFDNQLFVLKVFDVFTQPHEWCFDHELFWIQIHNLPMFCMTKEKGRLIGESLGKLVKVDTPENGIGWGGFLRVRVEISLIKAVVRGRWIKVNGQNVWASVKYEKMPRMCFHCGWLTHGKKGCLMGGEGLRNVNSPQEQFGLWLRAERGVRKKGYKGGGEKKCWERKINEEDSSRGEESASYEAEGKDKATDSREEESLVVKPMEDEGESTEMGSGRELMVVKRQEGLEEKINSMISGEGKVGLENVVEEEVGQQATGCKEVASREELGLEKVEKINEFKKTWKRRAREMIKSKSSGKYAGKSKRLIRRDEWEEEREEVKIKKVRREDIHSGSVLLLASAARQPCQEQ